MAESLQLRGRKWVLLRGLAREAAHWGKFPEILREKFEAKSIECLDLPGVGAHITETAPLTVSENTESVRATMSPTDGEKPILLAISFGAMVGAEWLNRFPKDFAAAVLINTSFKGLDPWYRRFQPKAVASLTRVLVTRDRRAQEKIILDVTSRLPSFSDELERRTQIAEARPIRRITALRQLLAASKYELPATKPSVPVLFLSSRGDVLANPNCSARVAALWTAQNFVHPWAGHDLPLDDPEWVVGAIARWAP